VAVRGGVRRAEVAPEAREQQHAGKVHWAGAGCTHRAREILGGDLDWLCLGVYL
jgi:hypothetical protein